MTRAEEMAESERPLLQMMSHGQLVDELIRMRALRYAKALRTCDSPMTATEVSLREQEWVERSNRKLNDPEGSVQKSLAPILEPIIKKIRQLAGTKP